MGCETDLPPEEPEVGAARVVTDSGTECNTELDYPHPVTIYNRLDWANISNLEEARMATGYKVDCEKMADESPTENNGVFEMNDLNHGKQEDIIRSDENNMAVSNQLDMENLSETTRQVDTDDGERGHNTDNIKPSEIPIEVQHVSAQNTGATSSGDCTNDNVLAEVLNDLDILRDRLQTATDIPSILLDVSLNCLKPSTIDYLSYHLDPESDVMSPEGKLKDYRGLAEWIGLEPVFIKYISRSSHMLKTKEVLSKWLTIEEEPLPILKNLRECLLAIERPDILEDMSVKMALDAVTWKKTQIEARTRRQVRTEDTSWQLTRHDVVSGQKTMYTACLLYADEDELMAQLITKLYKTAYKDTLFFLPQFDLKQGKYVLDTTARVIDERCDKKVIFLLSEYFYASNICQFAVNYAAAHGTGNGNLIPFHLTRNVTTVPNVLKGIAGIRWFRKATRQHTWQILADCLLAEKIANSELLEDIKGKIEKMVAKDSEYYLQDPPYDEGIDPPGIPIDVVEPAGSSSMPSPADIEMQRKKIEEEMQRKKEKESKSKFSLIKQIKKAIFEKILPQSVGSRHSKLQTSPSPSMASSTSSTVTSSSTTTPSTTAAVTSSSKVLARTGLVSASIKGASSEHSNIKFSSFTNTDGSELGACGGSDVDLTQNDLNLKSGSKSSVQCKDELNISESESTVLRAKAKNLRDGKISKCVKNNTEGNFSSDLNCSEENLIYNRNNSSKHCTRKQKNVSLKAGGSYEMKVIKNNANGCETETLISKDDKDETDRVKRDVTTDDLNETDSLMSHYK